MASIDERVVAMAFENATFEQRIAITMATLGKLNDTLAKVGTTSGLSNIEADANKVTLKAPMSALDKLKAKLGLANDTKGFTDIEKASEKVTLGAPMSALDKLRSKLGFIGSDTKGFNDIEKASQKVTLSDMGKAVDGISAKFSALQVAGVTALATVVHGITQQAGQLTKALTLEPLTGGLEEYATNLNSIQTILANTEASGAGLKDVNRALQELNAYSDKTIYNFSQMAKNIGTFTAAGVDLDTATQSIKGIANLAALSGSNSQQASTAMYQLSQAISAGRVSLQDWNSVVNAGMGGTVFQRALAQTAENMGKLDKGAVTLKGSMKNVTIEGQSFRESIMAAPGKESWLTSDVLTKTLQQFTGDLSDAELAAQGFNAEQIKSIQQTAKTAQKAATEVKTLSGVFDVAKESMGSGWAATWQLIFGDFEEAKSTFTGLSQAFSGLISKSADARNKVLADWKALGGRTALIEGIKNVFEALGSVIKPIRDAFRQVFPATTGKELYELTVRFRDFTDQLKIGPETAENLRRTFAGLFAVLSIGKTIIGHVVRVIFDLLGVVTKGSGGFLNFTGTIGDFLVSLDQAISKGDSLRGFFDGLGAVLRVPLEILGALTSAFFGLFNGADSAKADGVASSLDNVSESLKPLDGILKTVVAAWGKLVDILGKVKGAVQPMLDDIAASVGQFTTVIANSLQNANYDNIFAALQTTLIGGIFITIKKALGGDGLGAAISKGLLKDVNGVFGALTGNLEAMQKNIQAGTLLKIAAAITVLAAGILILSKIDPKALTRAMTAVAVGLAQLVGAMALLSKVAGGSAFITMPFIAASMVGLAVAVTVLAGAVKIFSTMSWEELAKGLAGVAGSLVAIALGTKLMGPGLLVMGPGLIALALALNVLAVAVKIFATLSWTELAKGILGVGGALTALGFGLSLIGPSVLLVGPGLIGVALAMNLLSGAVRSFGGMNLLDMGKGILGIAAALLAIAFSISLIPPTVALQAAGLVILAVALTGIAGAIKMFGGMNIVSLVKGIAALGATLIVLAIGLTAMSGTLPGSVALLAAAAAFAILAPTLGFLGTLKWGTIFKGLAAVALTLGTLAVAGALAAGPLTALGIALLPLGAAMILAATATLIFAKGLSLLGSEGAKGLAVMVTAVTAFVALIPKIVIDFVKGLVVIIAELAKLSPAVAVSIGKIIDTMLAIVTDAAPKMAVAMTAIVTTILVVLTDNAPRIVAAGFSLLLNLLSGISSNIGLVIAQVADIIVKFLTALTGHAPELVEGGVKALLAFLLGIANKLPDVVAAAIKVVTKFLEGIATKLPSVVSSAATVMRRFLGQIAAEIPGVIAAGTRILVQFVTGIGNAYPKIVDAAVTAAGKFVRALAKGLVKLVNIGFETIIDFMNGIAKAIRTHDDRMIDAGFNIADAIIDGMFLGLKRLGPKVIDAIGDLISSLPKKALGILGIHSPSKVFQEIGQFTMAGLAVGLNDGSRGVNNTIESATKGVIDTAKATLSNVPNLLDGLMDLDPIITPVLDLSSVERSAKDLADMTNVTPITAAASFGQAAAISEEKRASETAQADQAEPGVSKTFKFEQNNYSPEALDDVEIYRQTNNQLALLKRAVGVTP